MCSEIFYAIGVIIILLNIFSLFNYKTMFEANEWLIKYKKIVGKSPLQEEIRNKGDFKMLMIWAITVLLTVIWMIFGLLTGYWPIFLVIFITNISFNYISRFTSYQKIKLFLRFIKSIVMISSIIFIILNHYYLKLI